MTSTSPSSRRPEPDAFASANIDLVAIFDGRFVGLVGRNGEVVI